MFEWLSEIDEPRLSANSKNGELRPKGLNPEVTYFKWVKFASFLLPLM
ncbi:hypothetical protein [Neobacillus terrae]|nr:hypothetical protein [Neobacillus terrae]NHM31905.1 hypothetical protein [Neobacillus terrae]